MSKVTKAECDAALNRIVSDAMRYEQHDHNTNLVALAKIIRAYIAHLEAEGREKSEALRLFKLEQMEARDD